MVSLAIAYALWFFLGWTGLHLFYVGRDDHMFVYLTTGGGYFLGWLRDGWRLPSYCEQHNTDGTTMNAELNIHNIRIQSSPSGPHWFQPARIFGTALTSSLYGYVLSSCLDLSFLGEELSTFGYSFMYSVGIAFAVWLIGNIGMQQGPFKPAAYGSLFGWALSFLQTSTDSNGAAAAGTASSSFFWCFVLSYVFFVRKAEWTTITEHFQRRGGPSATTHQTTCHRIFRLGFAGFVFVSLSLSGCYFHAKTTDKTTGEETRLRDSIDNLLRSPIWSELYSTLKDAYNEPGSWENFFSSLSESVDLDGENSARKTLGVDDSATLKEIKSVYRRKARELHPDKGGDPTKFMEMQEAYERLKKVLTKREKRDRSGSGSGSESESDRSDRGRGGDASDAEREALDEEMKIQREDDAKLKEAKEKTYQKRKQQQNQKKKNKKNKNTERNKKKNKSNKKKTKKKRRSGDDL